MSKTFLDSAGLQTFLNDIKYNYAQASSGFIPLKASQLETARTITLSGAVTGNADFDGTQGITIATTAGSHIENVIEEVQVNGTALTVTDKTVNVVIPSAAVTDVQTSADGSSYATVLDGTVAKIDLSSYALKSDITAVMKFKGTKTSDELAALTGMTTGDVYSIVSGGTGTTYKVGSEYAYDGSAWVELGPVIDLSGYVAKTQTINSKALSGNITLDGSDVALSTNYAVASSAAAPAAGDSIDTAVGKLQKEVADAASAATTYAFAEGTTNGAFQVTPTVGGVTGSAQSVSIHGLGSAAYAATTDFVSSTLAPAEAGAQVNVIESITVNGGSALTITDKNVDITIPAATVTDVQFKGKGDSGFATALDGTVAKIDVSGYALTSDLANFITVGDLSLTAGTGDYVTGVAYNSSTGVFTETKAAKGSVADNNTGLVDGDTVYDYIEAMAISDATINGLFPATPSSGS